MIDHGYIGNFDDGDITEPGYMDEEFVDAHSEDLSLEDSSTTKEGSMDEGSDGVGRTITPPPIELPASFPVLASGCLSIPKFTNYAVDFVETLDYCFASLPSQSETFGFQPIGEAPMLTEEMVKDYVAMPNASMPSDHLAVVCDFEWAKYE